MDDGLVDKDNHGPGQVVLRPSRDYLSNCRKLCIDAVAMAEFLGITVAQIRRLASTDRVPIPLRLGRCRRWSVQELAEWVNADCPRRGAWVRMRGWGDSSQNIREQRFY